MRTNKRCLIVNITKNLGLIFTVSLYLIGRRMGQVFVGAKFDGFVEFLKKGCTLLSPSEWNDRIRISVAHHNWSFRVAGNFLKMSMKSVCKNMPITKLTEFYVRLGNYHAMEASRREPPHHPVCVW